MRIGEKMELQLLGGKPGPTETMRSKNQFISSPGAMEIKILIQSNQTDLKISIFK